MLLESPLVNYNSISINGNPITLNTSSCRASFEPPYNKIDVSITPTNCSLRYYEVRVTRAEDPYDIEVGSLAYWNTNIALNKTLSFSINITPEIFKLKEGEKVAEFRLSFYAKSSEDGSWDVTYLVFTLDNSYLCFSDGSTFEVLTTKDAPQIN